MAVFSFRPAPKISNCNSQKIQAKVIKVYASGSDNLVFELEDVKGKFYIKRGNSQMLTPTNVECKLLNQEVIITYPKNWTIFDPFNRVHPIFKMTFQKEVIFIET